MGAQDFYTVDEAARTSERGKIPPVEENRRDALTIRQAAALLNCHPNTVRNRIKAGKYEADRIQTEHGETYLIPRSELSKASTTNSLVGPTQPHPVPTPLPDVREAMRAMLEPFVEELGAVREELGREKERREQAERRIEELERQLETPEAPEAGEEEPEDTEPRSTAVGAQEGAQEPQGRSERSWRQRVRELRRRLVG